MLGPLTPTTKTAQSADFQKMHTAQFFGLGRQAQNCENKTLVVRWRVHFRIFGVFWVLAKFSKKWCSSSHQIASPLMHH